jgi:hypothetical protein
MLYFYKYEEVEVMLKRENLNRYSIQVEVVKMILVENVRELLLKSQKQIYVISQDVKKQLRIV